MAMTEAQIRDFFADDPAALARALDRLHGTRPRQPQATAQPVAQTARTVWSVPCPRHRWPEVHDALKQAKASLTTGTLDEHLELLVTGVGVRVLERLGLSVTGRGRDPWRDRLKAGAGVDRYRKAKDSPPSDPLEQAFRRMRDDAAQRNQEAA